MILVVLVEGVGWGWGDDGAGIGRLFLVSQPSEVARQSISGNGDGSGGGNNDGDGNDAAVNGNNHTVNGDEAKTPRRSSERHCLHQVCVSPPLFIHLGFQGRG